MHTSLILYAEHEFNASTFTCRVGRRHRRGHVFRDHRRHRRAARAETWRRQRGLVRNPEAATPTPTKRRPTSASVSRNREVVIGFGHAVYTIADPRNKVIKEVARRLSHRAAAPEAVRHRRPDRGDDGRRQEDVRQSRLVQRHLLPHARRADRDVHAAVRDLAHLRLGRARDRTAHRQQDDPPDRELYRPGEPEVRADRPARQGAIARRARHKEAIHALSRGVETCRTSPPATASARCWQRPASCRSARRA